MKQPYIDTVRLLIDIAPDVFASNRFAMKGGTAINLFVQDMPRLSVDIDVVFTDHGLARDEALQAIQSDLVAAANKLDRRGYATTIPRKPGGEDVKLFVQNDVAEVKVEVNHIFRGTLLPTKAVPLTQAAQDLFTAEIAIPMLDTAEIYGSKLVAAMDRQHPRDIFDVLKMYEKFGLDAAFVDCFVAYLAGHNRPVHEVLFSADAPLEAIYENHFRGMTSDEVSLETLARTRANMKRDLPRALTPKHKDFLLTLVRAAPEWDLMPFPHLQEIPALKWKLANLEKLKATKRDAFDQQYTLLKARLGGSIER
jgi:predicted nucleotidyltransferase component of viral defense system